MFNQRTILTMEQIKDFDRKTYYYPLLIENKLIHCMLNGDITAVEIFNQLMTENDPEDKLSPEAFKNFIFFAIIGTMSRVVQELKMDAHGLLKENEDFSALSDQWNRKDIIPRLRKMFEDIFVICE